MTEGSAPTVRLYQNPWSDTLNDDAVAKILYAAALAGEKQLHQWIMEEKVDKDHNSFACVFLDPTRQRYLPSVYERVLAVVLIGPNAERLVANGAAKADACDRHGQPNGQLVRKANFCLGNGDFAYGHSASYRGSIAGGSGLSEKQDRVLARLMLKSSMKAIHLLREAWLAKQREDESGQRWFNPDDMPGEEYLFFGTAPAILTYPSS